MSSYSKLRSVFFRKQCEIVETNDKNKTCFPKSLVIINVPCTVTVKSRGKPVEVIITETNHCYLTYQFPPLCFSNYMITQIWKVFTNPLYNVYLQSHSRFLTAFIRHSKLTISRKGKKRKKIHSLPSSCLDDISSYIVQRITTRKCRKSNAEEAPKLGWRVT